MKRNISLFSVIALLLLAAFFLRLSVVQADAASSSEIREQINALEDQQAELEEQMQALEAQLSQNLADIEDTAAQKSHIDQQIFLLQAQLSLTDEQIAAFNVLIADKQEELDEAEASYDKLHEAYKERIRAMEEEGELSYWSVLFQANSFSDLLDRLNMIQEIAAADNRRLQELSAAAEAVAKLQLELKEEKAALEQTRQEQLDSQQLLGEKRETANQLLQQLLAKGEEYEQLLEQSEERQEQLMEEVAKLEVEYDEAAYQEWLATYVPPTTAAPTTRPTASAQENQDTTAAPETESDSTQWLTPVPYYTLTSPFGMRFHPILNIWRMHNGIDMACDAYTPIYASRGGVVSIASYQDGGAGNYVQINHGDGYSSIYMHMIYYIVSTGDYVAAGQTIGYVGSTGLSKGNHLHFGISYNGTYVNPLEYLP